MTLPVPARLFKFERRMKTLWFWEMCKKSRVTSAWLRDCPVWLVDAVVIRVFTVDATKGNPSRWNRLVGMFCLGSGG